MKNFKLTIEMTYYAGAKVAKNGNDLRAAHMNKSKPCWGCGGPKSYRADLCRQCAIDYRQLGPSDFERTLAWRRLTTARRQSHHEE